MFKIFFKCLASKIFVKCVQKYRRIYSKFSQFFSHFAWNFTKTGSNFLTDYFYSKFPNFIWFCKKQPLKFPKNSQKFTQISFTIFTTLFPKFLSQLKISPIFAQIFSQIVQPFTTFSLNFSKFCCISFSIFFEIR